MPRIIIGDGDTPDGSDLQTIGDQGVITLTTAQMLGWASPPAGAHVYNTDEGIDFIYDGTTWRRCLGRAVGVKAHRPNPTQTVANLSDVQATFNIAGNGLLYDTEASDGPGDGTTGASPTAADGIAQSGGDFTIPYDGVYAITFHAYFALQMDAGGYAKIFHEGQEYAQPVPVDGTTGGIEKTIACKQGDLITFVFTSSILSTADNQATGLAEIWRLGPLP